MQPNCPSGEERGETVTDRRQRRGIARPAQASRGRTGRPLAAPEDQTKGLVLTEDGVADPKKKERTLSPPGLTSDHAQGMEAAGPRRQTRFTTARPARGCTQSGMSDDRILI